MTAIPGLRTRLGACRGVLVDSNVLLDISTSDPNWSGWSERAVAECAGHAPLIINPIILEQELLGWMGVTRALTHDGDGLPTASQVAEVMGDVLRVLFQCIGRPARQGANVGRRDYGRA